MKLKCRGHLKFLKRSYQRDKKFQIITHDCIDPFDPNDWLLLNLSGMVPPTRWTITGNPHALESKYTHSHMYAGTGLFAAWTWLCGEHSTVIVFISVQMLLYIIFDLTYQGQGEQAGSASSPCKNTSLPSFHFVLKCIISIHCYAATVEYGTCWSWLKEVVSRQMWLHKHLYQGHNVYLSIYICLYLINTVHKVLHLCIVCWTDG